MAGLRLDDTRLNDWFHRQGGRDRIINWLGIDSKINSVLTNAWERSKDYWNAGSSFFARFQLHGWRRLLNEALSESVSLATGAFIVLYAAALPALLEFDERKFQTGKFAVKFLDINGNINFFQSAINLASLNWSFLNWLPRLANLL